MAQEVGHLPGGEGPEATVWLLHPVDQVGGEGMAQGVEAPPLQPSRCQDAVVSFPEVYRPGIVSVFIRDKGTVLSEVSLRSQIQDGVHSGLVQGDVPLAGGGLQLADLDFPTAGVLPTVLLNGTGYRIRMFLYPSGGCLLPRRAQEYGPK